MVPEGIWRASDSSHAGADSEDEAGGLGWPLMLIIPQYLQKAIPEATPPGGTRGEKQDLQGRVPLSQCCACALRGSRAIPHPGGWHPPPPDKEITSLISVALRI